MRRKFIFALYRTAQVAALPLFLLYVLWRVLRNGRYAHTLGERLGWLGSSLQPTVSGAVWLHAVSVGEVISAAALVRELRSKLPGTAMYVSCTTLAGRDVAEQRLQGVADGVFYAPVDYVSAIRRVLRRLRPALVIVLETEIWPNLWREAKRSGAALLVVNGRISDRAWPRYQQFRWFFEPVLGLADRILVQSAHDVERYRSLGANAVVGGNLKYDVDPRSAKVAPELAEWCARGRQVWIAASTMPPAVSGDPDEVDAVLEAWVEVRAEGRRLILAPRKPEMFDEAARKLEQRGVAFVRRTAMRGDHDVLLLDTVGELAGLFRYASAVFMGGTLASRGGHNILEPAAFAKPVIVGPHMENFREIAGHFASASAVVEIAGPGELAPAVSSLLGDLQLAERIGERARDVAESERGATARAVAAAVELHIKARPRWVPYGPLRPLLWFASLLWRAGVALHRAATRPKRLQTPVVSVGGLAMGGAGKTPLVRSLAKELAARGHRVGILTRGYGRRSDEVLALAPGERRPADQTGDEAQLYLSDGVAAVGIGADRRAAGKLLEQRFHPDVLLLDDGFQHWRLHRDFDIVVVDGVDRVFPLGRAREPESALRRADRVVEKRLRSSGWVPSLDAEARYAALCGIGDPSSFWRTLAAEGLSPVRRVAFPDHHKYSPAELRRVLESADALLTTEKDAQNIPPGFPVHYLRVEFDLPEGLADAIEERLRTAVTSRQAAKSLL